MARRRGVLSSFGRSDEKGVLPHADGVEVSLAQDVDAVGEQALWVTIRIDMKTMDREIFAHRPPNKLLERSASSPPDGNLAIVDGDSDEAACER